MRVSRMSRGLLRQPRGRTEPGSAPAEQAGAGCLVCGATQLRHRRVTYARGGTQSRDVTVCRSCGYVAVAEKSADRYRGKTSLDELPEVGLRTGTIERPGREYQMARMASEILSRAPLDVLVFGAGRSMDNHHIAGLPEVGHVAIGDVMSARDDMEFHDANEPARRTFDVVVASEVIEHFRDPRSDFRRLAQFVRKDGLIVCSTTLRASTPLARQRYIFYPDHTSLYSPRSLEIVADDNGMMVDFRWPSALGPMKRYVLLSRSRSVMRRERRYFGQHATAPSEKDL